MNIALLKIQCYMETNLIILVKSFARNVKRRYAIRNTWGSCRNDTVQTVFLLRYSDKSREIVVNEYTEYKDIIQGSFKDIYKHYILKLTWRSTGSRLNALTINGRFLLMIIS